MSLEENIRQLRDSLTVTSAQTLRHETLLKDHAEWLRTLAEATARHVRAIEAHDREMAELRENARKDRKEARERGKALDERIDKLVSAIGKMIREPQRKGVGGFLEPVPYS